MKSRLAGFALLATSTLATGAFSATAARAADVEKTFLIPASDGYGVAECLTGTATCGKVVADAWCEAQGFAGSASFGPAASDEYTGAIDATPVAKADRPIRITCQD